jgi:hypothetical protein
LQIKKYSVLDFNQCLIVDEYDEPNNIPVPPPPPPMGQLVAPINSMYDKYFKMLKMGIPIMAVKNNMLMDGYDANFITSLPDTIEQFKQKLNSTNNNCATVKKFVPSDDMLSDMKSMLKDANKTKRNPSEKIAKKNSGFVPTLSDITTILSQLKKPKNIPNKISNDLTLDIDIN